MSISESKLNSQPHKLLGTFLGPGVVYLLMMHATGITHLSSHVAIQLGLIISVAFLYICWLYITLTLICKTPVSALNFEIGNIGEDIARGFVLALALSAFSVLFFHFVSIPSFLPSPSYATSMLGWNGLAIFIFVGPYLWIYGAILEEFLRASLLFLAWSMTTSAATKLLIILLGSLLFGMVHIYQGYLNALEAGCEGVIYGLVYFRYGRIFPLILAHGLYDTYIFGELMLRFRG